MYSTDIILRIMGKADGSVITLSKNVLHYDPQTSSEIVLFCSYSGFDIPVGFKFSRILNNDFTIIHSCDFVVEKVTQQFFKSFDEIPRGWKTICKFNFIEGSIPNAVKSLPIIKDWYDASPSLIFQGTSPVPLSDFRLDENSSGS